MELIKLLIKYIKWVTTSWTYSTSNKCNPVFIVLYVNMVLSVKVILTRFIYIMDQYFNIKAYYEIWTRLLGHTVYSLYALCPSLILSYSDRVAL